MPWGGGPGPFCPPVVDMEGEMDSQAPHIGPGGTCPKGPMQRVGGPFQPGTWPIYQCRLLVGPEEATLQIQDLRSETRNLTSRPTTQVATFNPKEITPNTSCRPKTQYLRDPCSFQESEVQDTTCTQIETHIQVETEAQALFTSRHEHHYLPKSKATKMLGRHTID